MSEDGSSYDELAYKYQAKLKEKLGEQAAKGKDGTIVTPRTQSTIESREYKQFKDELLPKHLNYYEKLCNFAEKTLKVSPDKKVAQLLKKSIDTCHLDITPTGVMSFAILAPLVTVLFFSLISFFLFQEIFFILFFVLTGLVAVMPLQKLPQFLASNWRMKASSEMVISVFYVVTFMRHTSNLENAINFAADHLTGPLSLDFKRIIWNIETQRFDSVQDSLTDYLNGWKETNMEFVEAFHLIQSSLYESSNDRRLTLLDKSLDVILSETYEKMMHYAQNLKGPIETLNMLGIILPILGLVILPLVVSFMSEIRWFHLTLLYNIALPIGVYYFAKTILASRPTGYGDIDVSEYLPEMKKFRKILINVAGFEVRISPLLVAILVGLIFVIIGLLPVIMHAISPGFDPLIYGDPDNIGSHFRLLEYRALPDDPGKFAGPYSVIATIIAIMIPLGAAFGVGLYNKYRSQNVMKLREEAKRLEEEFSNALFQLGNRLGDGIPAEIAFSKVAEVMEGTISGNFFRTVDMNIRRLGLNLQSAIFDPKVGAIRYFPSKIIDSSMKVLIEATKKGPQIAAQALLSIARYVKEIHRVNERLKDLLADSISSMKSQVKFLTPTIAGIVIGITSMVTTIISKLSVLMENVEGGETGLGSTGALINMFSGSGVPTYFFQIIVGLYVVQIIYILTILTNTIENGSDKLNERFLIGRNCIKGPVLYAIIGTIVMILFNMLAGNIISGAMTQ